MEEYEYRDDTYNQPLINLVQELPKENLAENQEENSADKNQFLVSNIMNSISEGATNILKQSVSTLFQDEEFVKQVTESALIQSLHKAADDFKGSIKDIINQSTANFLNNTDKIKEDTAQKAQNIINDATIQVNEVAHKVIDDAKSAAMQFTQEALNGATIEPITSSWNPMGLLSGATLKFVPQKTVTDPSANRAATSTGTGTNLD